MHPRSLAFLMFLGAVIALVPAQEHRPSLSGCHAVKGVTILVRPGLRIEGATIVIRDGVIEAAGQGAKVPADAEVIDGKGLVVTAGFAVMGPAVGERPKTPDPKQPDDVTRTPDDWARMGVSPQRTMRPLFEGDEDPLPGKDWLKQGITTVVAAPSGRIIPGQASVISVAPGDPSERLLRENVALIIGFSRGRGGYPSSLMGTVAALRQTFLDADRLRIWRDRFTTNPKGLKTPPHRPELEAVIPALKNRIETVFACRTAMDIRRAVGLADEFGISAPYLRGGRALGDGGARIAKAGGIAVLEVDLPKIKYASNRDWIKSGPASSIASSEQHASEREPGPATVKQSSGESSDATVQSEDNEEAYAKTMRSLLATREREQIAPHALAGARLEKQGIPTIAATANARDFVKHLRTQVRFGMSEDACLAAVTTLPAKAFGFEGAAGAVEAGYRGDLIAWRGEPFTDGAIAHVFCRGERYDVGSKKPRAKGANDPPSPDISGSWQVKVEGRDEASTLTLKKDGDGYSGDYKTSQGDAPVSSVVVEDEGVVIVARFATADFEMEITLDGTLSKDRKSMSGTLKFGTFGERPFTASKGGGQ